MTHGKFQEYFTIWFVVIQIINLFLVLTSSAGSIVRWIFGIACIFWMVFVLIFTPIDLLLLPNDWVERLTERKKHDVIMPLYQVTNNNIRIYESGDIKKRYFNDILDILQSTVPDHVVFTHRSRKSLIREWTVHNFLYRIGYKRNRTGDVDLNYPHKWYVSLAYNVLGILMKPFIK